LLSKTATDVFYSSKLVKLQNYYKKILKNKEQNIDYFKVFVSNIRRYIEGIKPVSKSGLPRK